MSTGGAVAWRKGRAFKGVYSQNSSYPTHLGVELFGFLQRSGFENVLGLLARVGDWSEMLNDGVCPHCGKLAGHPHSISGVMQGFGPWTRPQFVAMRKRQSKGRPDLWAGYKREIATLDEIIANVKRTGYPDPDAKHHQHGHGAKDQFNPFKNPLGIDWIYVLVPDTRIIEVWRAVEYSAAATSFFLCWSGHHRRFPNGASYTHVHVADVSLDSEPDWQAVQDRGIHMLEKSRELEVGR
jgi:hypothetical protein